MLKPDGEKELRIAKHHDSSGKVRRRAIYPWAAAGGLYATPREYALAMIPLLNSGLLADGQRFLPAGAVTAMLTDYAPEPDEYFGLGLHLTDPTVSESGGEFFHGGNHEDRAYARMVGNPSRNQGIVVMVNSEGDRASKLVNEVVKAFRCAYGWDSGSGCMP
jgi:CubicO group peptidase (beta-lactamase class C family)